MPVTYSPLRYPGGKTQLAPFVTSLLRANYLMGGVYAEPFAGGAGLGLKLLFDGHISELWLNDIDHGIASLWKTVLERPDDLCELIETTQIHMGEWARQKSILRNKKSSQLSLAFATLFLNRTNRSGIIGGGVIGGKAQSGPYKLGCRFNRSELTSKVQRIASYKDVIRISDIDARECISKWAKSLPKRSLLNIDPPYFLRGQELYLNFYEPSDHEKLAGLIRKLKCNWMVTYDDAKEVMELYSGLPVYRKGLTYYAQVKRRANELLVICPELKMPDCAHRDLRAA